MANADNAAPRSSLGWLSRLVLWGVVIAFGYLYLSSIDREAGTPTTEAFMDSLAKLSPIPINVLPNSSDEEKAPAVAPKADEPKVAAPVNSADQEPVRETESSVFANSLIRQQQAAPAVSQPVPQVPAPVAPAPREMSQSAPAAAPAPAPFAAAPKPAASAAAAPAPAAPVAAAPQVSSQPVPSGSYDWEAVEKRRAEVMAQYEAMRREADERRRQQWEQMRSYAPPAPYGYPGYAPTYPPGVYAPVR